MFTSRDHLITHMARCPLRRCVLRALDDPYGKVENLGGFVHIPPGDGPGFIVAVTSKHGQTWYVAAVFRGMDWVVRIVPEVPWQWWVGEYSANPLYMGDQSDEYQEKKTEALSRQSKRPVTERRLPERDTSGQMD